MFQSKKAKFQQQLDQAIQTSYEEIGAAVVDSVKGETPVSTGELKKATDYKKEEDGLYIYNTKDYAPFVEFGTVHQYANPFMRRGIVKSVSEVAKIIKQRLKVSK